MREDMKLLYEESMKNPEFRAEQERRRKEKEAMENPQYRLKYYREVVPEPDRFNLLKLQPSEKSYMPLDKQKKLIDIMRANPEAGYAMFGPSGWSKSTLMYALFREALNRQWDSDFGHGQSMLNGYQPVVFVRAAKLMDQMERWKYHDGPYPILTVGKIERMRKLKLKFSVFMDEYEKVRKSPFRMEESYKLLEAMYDARGYCQLVIAGNMKKSDLDDVNLYQEGTPRRIEALTSPYFLEFGGK